ncbi:MAG: hypothetical protein RIS35_3414 [Pseudomonadota bacterium]|jgi:cytochrome b561
MSTTVPVYTSIAKVLHWTMALMLPPILALGFYMRDLPFSPQKLQFYAWHKWAGVTVFLLVLVRLGWRALNPPPPLPETMHPGARRLAGAAHAMLYLLMLAIPLSGWLMSSAKGFQTVWFGVLPIPDLIDKDPELGDRLATLHFVLNLSFLALLVAHVGAVIKHAVLDRDPILARMLPTQP